MTCLDPKTIWPNEAVPNVRYRDFFKNGFVYCG